MSIAPRLELSPTHRAAASAIPSSSTSLRPRPGRPDARPSSVPTRSRSRSPIPPGRVDHPPAIPRRTATRSRAASDGPGPAASPPSPGRSGPLGSRREPFRMPEREEPLGEDLATGRSRRARARSGPAPSGVPQGPTRRRTRHLGGSGWSSVGQPHHAPAAGRRPAELLLQDLAVVRQQDLIAPPRPQPIEREDRLAVGTAVGAFELDDQQPLPLERRVLDGRRRRCRPRGPVAWREAPPFASDGSDSQTNRIPPTIAVRRWRQKVSGVVTPSPVGVAIENESSLRRRGPGRPMLGPLTTKTVESIAWPIFDHHRRSREWMIAVWR